MAGDDIQGKAMGETNHPQTLRRLAKQADAQISAQLEMINGLPGSRRRFSTFAAKRLSSQPGLP
jgi:hypothetical protein